MTVVEVAAERLRVELVGKACAGLDRAAAALLADPGHPVHRVGMDAVEVNRVRVLGGMKLIRSRSPSRARSVGPGTRPL